MNRLSSLLGLTFALLSAHAAGEYLPQPIVKGQVCPVCNMFPANYPKWHAQVLFKDGSQLAFESAADMFRFLQNISKYDNKHTLADIGSYYVTDYEKRSWLDTKQAVFVHGSSVKGPMGNDLPAFGSKQSAESFARKSGGKLLRFNEITPKVIKSLNDDD